MKYPSLPRTPLPLLRAWCSLIALVLAGFALTTSSNQPGPSRTPATDRPLPEGERLLGELACDRCHALSDQARERLAPKTPPILDLVGGRVRPAWVRKLLMGPSDVKPGTTMPDLLHGLPIEQRLQTIEDLVHYLASQGGPAEAPDVEIDMGDIENGRQLYHELGCVACHAPIEEIWELEYPLLDKHLITEDEREFHRPKGDPFLLPGTLPMDAVPLGDVAAKWTLEGLTAFLVDPLATRPSGHMPAMALTAREARLLAIYLQRDAVSNQQERMPGLRYEYFEGDNDALEPKMELLTKKRVGSTDVLGMIEPHAPDFFGYRFVGMLDIAEEGMYRFFTTSDDGSQLFINGQLVVDNSGTHPMVQASGEISLKPGLASLEVTFYERAGGEGLEVAYAGPGFKKRPLKKDSLSHSSLKLPGVERLEIDPLRAERGREAFVSLGCSSCHQIEQRAPVATHPGKPLKALAVETAGCLSENPQKGLPRYGLSEEDRAALTAIVDGAELLDGALDAKSSVARTMDRFRCYACHRRDEVGGPHPFRKEFFRVSSQVKVPDDADMGDSGRLPPELTQVGRKLYPEWIRAVLLEGKRASPHLGTRMPQFGAANVGHLVEDFGEADPCAAADVERVTLSAERIEAGAKLVGINGIGCIRCHALIDYPSLGMPAVELTDVTTRIRPGWFKQMLLDPDGTAMGTRMPAFFKDGKSTAPKILNGDPLAQVEAIWAYLSLGSAMPVPEGLVPNAGEYELVTDNEPIQVGVFLEGGSARGVMVGHAERVHYAFDIENSRLTKTWKGAFFNARGTWHARAGQLEKPGSNDILEAPVGPSMAILPTDSAPWPAAIGRSAGFRTTGRRIGADGVPTFLYRFGDSAVEDRTAPKLGEDGVSLERSLRFDSLPEEGVVVRVATGKSITFDEQTGRFVVEGARPHQVRIKGGGRPFLHDGEQGMELRVRILPPETTVEIELWW